MLASSTALNATGVSYTVDFKTSSTGGVVAGNGAITVAMPSGVVLSTDSASITDLTTGQTSYASGATLSSGNATVTFSDPPTMAAGRTFALTLTNVRNPASQPGSDTITISTSSDTPTTTSATFST